MAARGNTRRPYRRAVAADGRALATLAAILVSLPAEHRHRVRGTIAAGAVERFGDQYRMGIVHAIDQAFAALSRLRWRQLEGLDDGGR